MEQFEIVIALLLAGAVLAAVARRIGAPYPALLALAGAVGAVVAGLPEGELDPEPAVALGAIVAPPDAAAATAVLRQVGLPQRLMVILEGESLFNDATALLVFRMAVGAAAAGSFSPWEALPTLALTCGGGALLGWALARLYVTTADRFFDETGTAVLVQFIATFAV